MNSVRTCGRILSLLLLGAAAVGCAAKHPGVVATPPPVVLVAHPVARDVTDYQVFTARTQAIQTVEIKARVTGYLTKINFKDGTEIKENDVLFEIDDRPYKAALDAAKASVEFGKASLVKAQAEYDIGQAVYKQNKDAISQQDLDKRLGARDEAKGSLDKAKAGLENAQLNYGWCKVTSPLTGRLNRHLVDVGNLVSADMTSLVNIVSLKPIWAYFDVDENSVRRYEELVAKGEAPSFRKGNVPVDMQMAGDKGFDIKGETDFVANQLDPNTGSIRLRAVFPNEDGYLVAGMFGRIRVPVGPRHPAFLVADAAIGTNQGQRYLLLVNDKNEVEYRPVDVGQMHGGLREVLPKREVTETGADGKGVRKDETVLTAKDRVIVDGIQRVRPGVKVDPRLVDMVTMKPVDEAKAPAAAAPDTKAKK